MTNPQLSRQLPAPGLSREQAKEQTRGLTSLDRRSEDVVVQAVVVAELKLRDVQRQILGADLVERADDPALEDAPEAFNRIRVDRADNVTFRGVVDALERVKKIHRSGSIRVWMQGRVDNFTHFTNELGALRKVPRLRHNIVNAAL